MKTKTAPKQPILKNLVTYIVIGRKRIMCDKEEASTSRLGVSLMIPGASHCIVAIDKAAPTILNIFD